MSVKIDYNFDYDCDYDFEMIEARFLHFNDFLTQWLNLKTPP